MIRSTRHASTSRQRFSPRFSSRYVTLLRVRHVGHRPCRPPREAYVSIRQHTSAYVDMLGIDRVGHREKNSPKFTARACASVLSAREEEHTSPSRRRPLAIASPYSIRQHTSAYVSIRQYTSEVAPRACYCLCIREHTSAHLSLRLRWRRAHCLCKLHTSAYVSIPASPY